MMEALNDHQHRMVNIQVAEYYEYCLSLNYLFSQFQGSDRSRDDLDMEQVLRNRGLNTPDVIQSALDMNDTNSTTIDNLFGSPEKILIPERYVPEMVSYLSLIFLKN